jgi:peroxiredoxin
MQIQPYEPPKPAPALSLPDLDGKTRQLADLRGKVVMVFFWTTW